ncbi:MAG: Lrp/AsnC family transcriptional regulator [Pseudomonadota bacterium]
MDQIDRKILLIVQENADISTAELAERVGLSQTPCWRRLKRLEEGGVIKKRVAVLDRESINLGMTAFVSVKTNNHSKAWLDEFALSVSRIPEVVEIHRMSGEVDYLLKVVCPNMNRFDAIYRRLIDTVDFSDVTSHFAMEVIKSTTVMPLDYAELNES